MVNFKFAKTGEIKKIPENSGVYCFKNKEILYIGKAVNIRERVRNHFSQPGFKENTFLNKTKRIGFIKTDSEIEALLLEAILIKKYQPKYNVMWRDDKNYFFVGITKEDFPQIFITHQRKAKDNYIGPFVDGKALKQTLKILRKIFPYRSCKTLPKKPCLWYQLDRCPAPCLLKSNLGSQIPSVKNKIEKELKNNARNIFEILKGKKDKVLRDLKKEMKMASKSQDFEEASDVRDKIFALEKVISHSKILEEKVETKNWREIEKELKKILKVKNKLSRIEAYDVSNIQGQEATGSMVTFIKGEPTKNLYRKFKIKIAGKPNDVAMLKEVIRRRLNHKEWHYPDLILVDGGITQFIAAKSELKNLKIPIIALAKKKNELFINRGESILLRNLPREVFDLILQLRDEAHRFAITYHKKLRKIKTFN
jgi:excinuclease ABC subunit C